MNTLPTQCLKITINASFENVEDDLSNPETHPEWGTEFFDEPLQNNGDGTYRGQSKLMGGAFLYKVESHKGLGIFDLYLGKEDGDFGTPMPVRLVRNGGGVDVLWMMAQMPGMPEDAFKQGCASMEKELNNLKARHEKCKRPTNHA